MSSEAGGQEREDVEEIRGVIERAIARWEAGEDFPIHLVLKAAQELLAALDAANSRAEEAEDKLDEALTHRPWLAHRPWVRVAQDAETRIRGLETALREIGLHPARYGIDASDFALDALSQATKREGTEKVTHGRHCSCRACGAQDWSEPQLAPCGMHGSKCPPVYDPRGYAGEVVATKREPPIRPADDPHSLVGKALLPHPDSNREGEE